MTQLDARYGRTSRRGGVIGVVVAALVVVGLAIWWFAWAHPIDTGPTLVWEDTGGQVVSDSQIDSTFQVTLDPGNAAQCAVEALDDSLGVIGWKVIDVPTSTDRLRTFTASILTTAPGHSGTVYTCWLVAS